MRSDSAGQGSLFQELREGREGVQWERALRALCFLLHGWCSYEGGRSRESDEPVDHLQAITFDKFAGLFARLWDEVFRSSGRLRLNPIVESATDGESITFPFPCQEMPGKHGRGRAVVGTDGGPIFLPQLLRLLEVEGILNYFKVRSPIDLEGEVAEKFEYSVHPRTTIEPALPLLDDDQFLMGFTRRESVVLKDLRHGLRRLGSQELRSLGTHESKRKTLEDIHREFRYLRRNGVLDLLVEGLRSGVDFRRPAEELWEYGEEALRKAARNKNAYERGRSILKAELSDAELRDIFEKVNGDAAEIWDGDVDGLARTARGLTALGGYLEVVAEAIQQEGDSSERAAARLEKASKKMRSVELGGFPERVEEVFEQRSRKLRSSVKDRLVEAILRARRSLGVGHD